MNWFCLLFSICFGTRYVSTSALFGLLPYIVYTYIYKLLSCTLRFCTTFRLWLTTILKINSAILKTIQIADRKTSRKNVIKHSIDFNFIWGWQNYHLTKKANYWNSFFFFFLTDLTTMPTYKTASATESDEAGKQNGILKKENTHTFTHVYV